MTTAVQVQFRRGSQSQMASFTGAAGEMNVDTTNNRVVVQDGTTAGGWPAARLSEIGGGFLNKFRNGAMDVWQRGTAPMLTAGTSGAQYTADGWIVGWTASASAAPTIAQAGGRLLTKNSLQVTGATNVTDVAIKQRIESLIAAAFCDQTVTVQAQIYNNTGGSITPKLSVNRPSAQDNYTSVTADVNAVNLQACANGAWTQLAYTFQANTASYNGLEIAFDFGNNFDANTKAIQITECDIRVTNGLPAGQQTPSNFVPWLELRPVWSELAFCQRYLEKSYDQGVAPGASTANGIFSWVATANGGASYTTAYVAFRVSKALDPAMTYWNRIGTANAISQYNGGSWTDTGGPTLTTVAIGQNSWLVYQSMWGYIAFHWLASAEL